MKKIIFFLLLVSSYSSFGQSYVDRVIVLNEGYFDYTANQIVVPPTIGFYDPATQVYSVIDTLFGARFASDIILSGDFLYVAADNQLYKYDRNNYSLLATQQIDGIRNISVWNDKLVVTRGDYDNTTFMPVLFNSYLQVFNASDLSFFAELDTVSGPKWSTQNMIMDGDMLYVAINNAYEWGNEKGLVGVVDMSTMYYNNEIDLGPDGVNPDNMFSDGNYIYTVNNKDWSGASISKIDLTSSLNTTFNMSQAATGCGTSCLRDGKINYQISGDVDVYEWDVQSTPSSGSSLGFSTNFYTLSFDDINNLLYASSTDFTSYGTVHIFDSNNNEISSFNCGVSPGNIVLDVRNSLSVNDNLMQENNVFLFDILGRERNKNSQLNKGFYIMRGETFYGF